jgi:hypothetical protein
MMLKPRSVVVLFVSAEWAKQANAEAILGKSKENVQPEVKAFPVRILNWTHSFGTTVQSIADNEPKGNEARLFVPWRSVIGIAWRPTMQPREARQGKFGFVPSAVNKH